MYCVGVYHPLPGKYDLPGDYDLKADVLRKLSVDGLPVTIEHRGIRTAVANLLHNDKKLTPLAVGEALDAQKNGEQPVGIVIHSVEGHDGRFYALFGVDEVKYPAVPFLVNAGALRGLSLTHRVGDPPVALELSLCVRPARPECFVLRVSRSLTDQLDYMRNAITRPSMSEKTPLQQLIDNLPEADRTLVTARFADLMTALDNAKSELTKQEEKAQMEIEEAKKAASQTATFNNQLLKDQIRMMSEQLNPDIRQAYYCEADNLIDELTSDTPATVLRAADRMICACNKQMMQMRAANVPRPDPPKRKAEDERPEPEAEPSHEDTIRRALTERFEL